MKWRKRLKRFLIALPIIAIILFYSVVPMQDQEIFLPGGTNKIADVVEIENENKSSGQFYSSYVRTITKPSRLVHWFSMTFLNGEAITLSQADEKASLSDLNAYSRETKKHSVDRSIIVAYSLAERPIDYVQDGVTILFRHPDYPIYSTIEIGDRIVGINGTSIHSIDDLQTVLKQMDSCSDVEVKVVPANSKNNKTKTIQSDLVEVEGTCKLGVTIMDHYTIRSTDPKIVSIDYSGYGGSAGLLQTLMIYNKLLDTDITNGLKISGTGGIDIKGNVTPIGGIKQKVLGAIKDGIDVYFAPDLETGEGNLYEIALDVRNSQKSDMEIIPVKHIRDAIEYLTSLQKEETFK